MSILLYGYIIWTLTKGQEKKLDGNYTRMLRAILNKYGRQRPKKQHPSRKLWKLDKSDMQDTPRELGTCSKVMYSSRPLHMDQQKQDDQLEATSGSSVMILDVAPEDPQETMDEGRGSERESEYPCRWLNIMMMLIYIKTTPYWHYLIQSIFLSKI